MSGPFSSSSVVARLAQAGLTDVANLVPGVRRVQYSPVYFDNSSSGSGVVTARGSILWIGLGLLVLLTSAIERAEAQGTDWRLTLRGSGPVRFGMTVEEAASIANGEVLDLPRTWECDDWMPEAVNRGARGVPVFQIRDHVVAYAILVMPEGRTWRGARIGMTEKELQRLYPGRLRSEPSLAGHRSHNWLIYEPPAPEDSLYRIVFETDGHRVQYIRAGLLPFVLEVGGCS
jgi:hypothetical protein